MDRRQKRSREAIIKAFVQLVSTKDYQKLSVQEIIDAANVGRSTFYAHFETKDHLLGALCEELFQHVFEPAPEGVTLTTRGAASSDLRAQLTHMLYHLRDENGALVSLIMGENSPIFIRSFKTYLIEYIRRDWADMDFWNQSKVPKDLLLNHIAGSFVETAHWWISRQAAYSPEAMAEFFLRLLGFSQIEERDYNCKQKVLF